MNCALPEALAGRLVLIVIALLATDACAQESVNDERAQHPLARCIVARQFEQPEATTYCLDSSLDARAAQLGELLLDLDEGCCDEDYAATLDTLAAEFDRPQSPAAISVDQVRLDTILAKMQVGEQAQRKTWWQRFTEWLDELLADEDQSDSALVRWLERLQVPDWAATALRWSIYIVLIGSALLIVLNELRVAGVLRRFRSPVAAAAAPPAGERIEPRGRRRPCREIDNLAPREQAIALFNSALAALRDAGALPPDDSLTNLELARRLSVQDRYKRYFDRLRSSADRALYAEIAPESEELSALRQAWGAIAAVTDSGPGTVTP